MVFCYEHVFVYEIVYKMRFNIFNLPNHYGIV